MKLSNKRIIKVDSNKFERALETPRHIYFVDFSEGDNTKNVRVYNREMKLVTDGHLAGVGILEDIKDEIYSWVSPKAKKLVELVKKAKEDELS